MTAVLRDPRLGLVWLAARLWVGWEFLHAGWDKITDSAWVGSGAPSAIHGFLSFAASDKMTTGDHPAVATWYAWLVNHVFLNIDGFMSYLIAFGEFAVGLGLILGMLTMSAAFLGALMNLNFMLAGSLGTAKNPLMFALELLIMFAGAAAYVYGVDRFLMPRLRAVWRNRGTKVTHRPAPIPH